MELYQTTRRSKQSILKEISPGCSWEGMMLKLKLQYFGHLMRRVDSLEKTLMLGGIGGRRRRGQPRMRWLDGITDGCESEWTPGVGDGQGGLGCCDSWGREELDMNEWLHFHFSLSCIGERNSNPLQYSCLENLMDRGVRWATVHWVTKESDTT